MAQPSLGGVLPSGGVEAVRIVQGGAPTAFVPSLPVARIVGGAAHLPVHAGLDGVRLVEAATLTEDGAVVVPAARAQAGLLVGGTVVSLGPAVAAARIRPATRALTVTDKLGPVRTQHKDRRFVLLQSKRRCQSCHAYQERTAAVCGKCDAALGTAEVSASVQTRELERFESRKSRKKGRQLNLLGSGRAAEVPRMAEGIFDQARRERAVRLEISELELNIGAVHYVEDQDSKVSVIEGFLIVHYLGKLSVVPGAGKAEGVTQLVVADFFNALGRICTAAGERAFPFGGYWNVFRGQGVTAALLLQVRALLAEAFGGDAPLLTNALTCRAWPTAAEGRGDDACYVACQHAVRAAAQQCFASLYAAGGRLHREGVAPPAPGAFVIEWVPRAVLHDVVSRACSAPTRAWLRRQTEGEGALLDMSRGWKGQLDDETGDEGLYTGLTMLQVRKTFSMCARAAGCPTDPTEGREAKKAIFLAVKNATKNKRCAAPCGRVARRMPSVRCPAQVPGDGDDGRRGGGGCEGAGHQLHVGPDAAGGDGRLGDAGGAAVRGVPSQQPNTPVHTQNPKPSASPRRSRRPREGPAPSWRTGVASQDLEPRQDARCSISLYESVHAVSGRQATVPDTGTAAWPLESVLDTWYARPAIDSTAALSWRSVRGRCRCKSAR